MRIIELQIELFTENGRGYVASLFGTPLFIILDPPLDTLLITTETVGNTMAKLSDNSSGNIEEDDRDIVPTGHFVEWRITKKLKHVAPTVWLELLVQKYCERTYRG